MPRKHGNKDEIEGEEILKYLKAIHKPRKNKRDRLIIEKVERENPEIDRQDALDPIIGRAELTTAEGVVLGHIEIRASSLKI